MRYHNIYWDLKRSTEILQDLLISHGLLVWQNTFDVWHWHVSIIVNMTWHCQYDMTWHFTFTEISHNIYWDLTRSTEISQELLRNQKINWFGNLYLTFSFDILHAMKFHDIWHCYDMTFDIWHLTWLMILAALALILMTLE